MKKKQISLFFRKKRDTGSFSIEASFEQMLHSFPEGSGLELNKNISTHNSNGVISRLLGVLEARKHCGDVNHVTGDVHFLVLGMPRKKTILTVHDCGFMTHKNPFARFILKLFWLDFPVRHCKFVIAVSEATKQEIINYTGCSSEKIIVIPTVITDMFRKVEKTFNDRCPRILHIGLAPNKNFYRHIEAISDINCELHIVGKLESHHIDMLNRFGINWTSEYNASQNDIQCAYIESDMLIFASTLEGFGMPILEAQTVGRPVLTSNISSMPEVAGEGACLVDPYSVQSIKEGIQKIINNKEYRDLIVEKGFENVKKYRAQSVALQYEDLYKKVLDK